MLIDRYAYGNRWRTVHPVVKGVLAGLGLLAALVAVTPLVPLLVVALMAGATICAARIPFAVYLKLLALPAGFLLAGVGGLALSCSGGELRLFTVPGVELPVFVSVVGLHQAVLVLARAFGAVTSLYLLALTTPLPEMVGLLRRLRVPHLLLELMVLAYRQLFTLLEMAHDIRVAQQARLGYATTGNRLRSLAALGANLALRSHWRARQLHRGLLARGFEEELHWLENEQPLPVSQLALAAMAGGGLLTLALLVGG